MKKLLSMFLLGLFGVVSFASADTIDGFTSDSDICTMTLSNTEYISSSEFNTDCIEMYNYDIYFCIDTINIPYSIYEENFSDFAYRVNSNPFCGTLKYADSYYDFFTYTLEDYSEDDYNPLNGVLYYSSTPITPPSSSSGGGSEGGSVINGTNIGVGVQSGVNAFLSGFGGLIPLFLMLGLPILIVSIFRNRIRSYIKHIFVVDKPRGDDIANCNLTLNKYGQFEHHIIGATDHGDYVDIGGMFVAKKDLPNYVDENLNFDYDKYFKAIDDRAGELAFHDERWNSSSSEERMDIYGEYKMRIFKHGL